MYCFVAEFHFTPGACSLFRFQSQVALDGCDFTNGVFLFDLNSTSPVKVRELRLRLL